MQIILSDSPEKTLNCGKEYAKSLQGGDVVLLNGEMGAGKTVFAKGVAKGLGIEDEILSPTYAYMYDYSGKLYHFDCYRLCSGAQAEALGLCDYFYADGVCLIEWAQNIADVLPERVKRVTIKKTGEEERQIIYE
ncbi:MAG: tRNA (adenosine(37)-N6)-threonylcarbamoyltransferase complex ATPase subunit type 1 TsaE [Clostridia bacterium]|nr:tRNA (adenosine(37)-N6)-threonylcarbamoyltransferase complex ATPase subunit type 1 TsaE [Clostridia bacterium]